MLNCLKIERVKNRIKFYLVATFLCALFSSCTDKRPSCESSKFEFDYAGLEHEKETDPWLRPQKIMYKGNLFSGSFKACENDKLEFEGTCVDGYLNGSATFYVGDEKYVLSFENGLLHGPWKKYSSESNLIEEGNFLQNKQEGLYRYYLNGMVWNEGNFVNDMLEGEYYKFNNNGTKESVVTFKRGVVIECIGDCEDYTEGSDDWNIGYPRNFYQLNTTLKSR